VRELFLLDPSVIFLNHGSFGACPRPVFEEYQRLQQELERQPVDFLARDRRYRELVDAAKARLAAYVGASPENLVFVPNATAAMNAVARGLDLHEGDEVLAPVGEYGAVDILWRHVCELSGARYATCPMPAGAGPDEALELLWAGVTGSTRVISVSHVSCFTGIVFPVEELCRRAREREILSVVDGAHAPGQITLEVEALGVDFYAGDCHKWLCAPKGSGFLYVHPDRHGSAEPVLVSWDWAEETGFAARQRWQGTRDPAAWLAVPAAIDFQAEHDWETVRERCHSLAVEARARLAAALAVEPLAPESFVQMVAVALPPCDPWEIQRRLWEEHRVEVVGQELSGVPLLRVSFQGYNDEGDLDALARGLDTVFRKV
jgi:isopenicillin-N epimerase